MYLSKVHFSEVFWWSASKKADLWAKNAPVIWTWEYLGEILGDWENEKIGQYSLCKGAADRSAPAVWIETTPHKSARAIIIQIRKSFYETRMNWNLKFPGLERGEEIAGLGWIKGKLALELKTTTFHRIWAAACKMVQVLVWEVWLADTILLKSFWSWKKSWRFVHDDHLHFTMMNHHWWCIVDVNF